MRIGGPIVPDLPKPSGRGSATRTNPALERMKPGDVFRAEVVRSSDAGILLRLDDGSLITAQRDIPLLVTPGEMVALAVKQKTDGVVTVELADMQASLENIDLGSLAHELGMDSSDRNKSVLFEIIKNGAMPTRQMVSEILTAMSRTGLSAEKASFMVTNGIPVNAANIAMLDSFLNQQVLLGNQLVRLLEVLSPTQNGQEFLPEMLFLQDESDIPVRDGTVQNHSAGDITAEMTIPFSADGDETTGTLPAVTLPEGAAAPPGSVAVMLTPETTPQEILNLLTPEQSEILNNTGSIIVGVKAEILDALVAQGIIDDYTPDLPPDISPDALPVIADDTDSLTVPQRQTVPMETVPVENVQTENSSVQAGTIIQGEEVSVAGQTESASVERPSAPMYPMTASGEVDTIDLKSMIENLFRRIDHSRAKILPRDIESVRVLKNLSSILESVKVRAPHLSEGQRAALGSIVEEIENNLRFLEQVNSHSTVVQIPVVINNQSSTAELYVFSEGKGKRKIDPENATMFLSLSTMNLDRVEAFVRLIGKNVECNFRLAGAGAANLLQANVSRLSELLEANGFRISKVSFAAADKNTNLFEAREEYRTQDKFYSVDIRI